MPHTSRKGWLARVDCYPENPIAAPHHAPLRSMARAIFGYFGRSIARIADPFSLRLIRAVLTGRAVSLLDLPERPPEYEDVGRLCAWQAFYPDALLEHSRFERVVMNALAKETLWIGGEEYLPIGMRGWSRIGFRRRRDGERLTMHIEDLLDHLHRWGNSNRR